MLDPKSPEAVSLSRRAQLARDLPEASVVAVLCWSEDMVRKQLLACHCDSASREGFDSALKSYLYISLATPTARRRLLHPKPEGLDLAELDDRE